MASTRRGLFGRVLAACADAATRRSFLGVADQALVSAASFATVVAVGRLSSQHELGIYSLSLTALLLLTNLHGELITAPYTVYGQRRAAEDLQHYNGSILLHHFVFATIGCFLLATLAVCLAIGGSELALAGPIGVMTLTLPFWLQRVFLRYICFANLSFHSALFIDFVAATLQILGLMALWLGGWLTAATALGVMGLASAIACAAWWLADGNVTFRVRKADAVADWKHNWQFSRWALASQLVGCSTAYVLPWILAHRHGEAATGMYAACVNLCGLAMMFVVGVAHSLTPQASRAFVQGGSAALRAVLTRTVLLFLATVGPFCLAAIMVGEPAMTIIYGSQFAGTGTIVSLLALSVLATSFAVAAGNGLWAVDRPQANLIADAVTLLVTLFAAWMLIGSHGVIGAALATLFGNTSGAVARLLILRWVIAGLQQRVTLAVEI